MRDTARVHGERGIALLAVLLVFVIIAGSSASFIWFMNQQQSRAGYRLRSTAALAAAEAGVHRALSILESVAPDGRTRGRSWWPATYSEALRVGAFAGRFLISVADEADGAILVSSVGEIAGVTRRLRARVYLASPALLAALYGRGMVFLDRSPAVMVIVPYGAGMTDRPWTHIAAGRGVEFASTDVWINKPASAFVASPGPAEPPEGVSSPTMGRAPAMVRLLMARRGELTLGPDRRRVDTQQLRAMGVNIERVALDAETFPEPPDVDRVYYQALATRNGDNAGLNEAAGKYFADDELARKRDSLYTAAEFERLTSYLAAKGLPGPFRNVIYIKDGGMALLGGQRLQVVEGALLTEGTVELAERASLEITHSPATRRLPGLLVLDGGALIVTQGARLRLHGLLYARKTIDAGKDARVDIVGAVLGDDPEFSFRTYSASVMIRYDPAVLGTPGLRAPADRPVVVWVAAWEELP